MQKSPPKITNPFTDFSKSRFIASTLGVKILDTFFMFAGRTNWKLGLKHRITAKPWELSMNEKTSLLSLFVGYIDVGIASLAHVIFWEPLKILDNKQTNKFTKVFLAMTLIVPLTLILGAALTIVSLAIKLVKNIIALALTIASIPAIFIVNLFTSAYRYRHNIDKFTVRDYYKNPGKIAEIELALTEPKESTLDRIIAQHDQTQSQPVQEYFVPPVYQQNSPAHTQPEYGSTGNMLSEFGQQQTPAYPEQNGGLLGGSPGTNYYDLPQGSLAHYQQNGLMRAPVNKGGNAYTQPQTTGYMYPELHDSYYPNSSTPGYPF